MLNYSEIVGWCAGCKVSGVTTTSLSSKDFPSIQQIMKNVVSEVDASVICVSVNEHETTVLEWLKKHKFRRGPVANNWIHGGHKTWMYFKQIPKTIYKKHTYDDWR